MLCFSFTANGLIKIRNFSIIPDHCRCCADESDLLVMLWGTSLLNSLMQDRARFLTSTGEQAAFIGDEKSGESVTHVC